MSLEIMVGKVLRQLAKLTLVSAVLIVALRPAFAQTETVVHSFVTGGKKPDGSLPFLATLLRDKTGKLYGTTQSGGAHNQGSIYRISFNKKGKAVEKLLYSFDYTDGSEPYGGLIMDKSGTLYGTTVAGGTTGYGTVFKLTKKGVQTVLHSFGAPGSGDGYYPYQGVVMDAAGNLYGTTVQGGTFNWGIVYKISSSGVYSKVYTFGGAPDGGSPVAGLTIDGSGNLFGTTASGGIYSNSGTVYEITAAGAYSKLHDVDIYTGEGSVLWGGVVLDSAGNLYGTTTGTVFQLTPGGVYTVLYTFGSQAGDGSSCYAGLVMDSAGNLYGTTLYGGSAGNGTVFEVTGLGSEKVPYDFGGTPDGSYPYSALTIDPSGNLYGTSHYGGSAGLGAVFKVVP